MAAPDYVPVKANAADRYYVSPPRLPQSWVADRPGELNDGQPMGEGLGIPGPDQGYALRLARGFEDRLCLGAGEHFEDAIAGCVAVALKRAACFGRAPVSPDVEIAFRLFGFLDSDQSLVAWRRELFEGLRHPHHYAEARHLVTLVPEQLLKKSSAEIAELWAAEGLKLLAGEHD